GGPVPVPLVMTAFLSRAREIRNLIPRQTALLQQRHPPIIHVLINVAFRKRQSPGLVQLVELRALLDGEAVKGNMVRLITQQAVEVVEKAAGSLSRQAENEVG